MTLWKGSETVIPMSRRQWLALTVTTLVGCGGGSSSVVGLPGTGGTGIFTQGKIAGFGSVIVNGIRFDDTAAVVRVDGSDASISGLRLGMVAGVMGLLNNDDRSNAKADRIEIWSIAQGMVTAVSAVGFTVLGMTIDTGVSTVFDGLMDASTIRVGSWVKVWGLQADVSAQRWAATRLEATTPAGWIATGKVQVSGERRFLNGIELRGGAAASLRNGDLVRVQGTSDGNNLTLEVEQVDRVGVQPDPASSVELEIEGVVTASLPNGWFVLGSVEVDPSGVGSASVQIGDRIEVYGVWRGQVLEATKIEAEDEESHRLVEIEAKIEAFTSAADFVVRGQRCDASAAVVKGGQASDLGVGVKVHLKGRIDGEWLVVTEIEIGD